MIKDNLKNAHKYYKLSPRIEAALKYLEANNLKEFPPDKYEIDGENIFMNVQEYETKVSNNIESHQKYIDIQYMVTGEENMGVTSLDNLEVTQKYNEENDLIFYKGTAPLLLVKEGEFVIFYPEDAHLPCQIVEESAKVKKVIVKVKK